MLSDQLKRRFPLIIRYRGLDYFERDKVEVVDLTDDSATAVVAATREYRVHLSHLAHPAKLACACTCPCWEERGVCEHAWAAVLAVGELLEQIEVDLLRHIEGLLAGDGRMRAPALGLPKPRAARPQAKPPRPQPKPPRASPPKAAATPAWQRRLERASARHNPGSPGQQRRVEPPRLEYLLDPSSWLGADNALTVVIQARSQRRDGTWGAPRQNPIAMADLPRLGAADRNLLALYDAMVNRNVYSWSDRRTVSLKNRWPVSRSLLPALLPQLAATGRAFLASQYRQGAAVPIVVDIEEPFRFVVQRDGDRRDGDRRDVEVLGGDGPGGDGPGGRRGGERGGGEPAVVRFAGVLRRGDETMPLGGVPAAGGGPLYLWCDNRVVCVDCGRGCELAREIAQNGPIEAPRADLPRLVAALAQQPGASEFLADELARAPKARPVGVVACTTQRGFAGAVTAALQFDYEGVLVEPSDKPKPIVTGEAVYCSDPLAEADLLRAATAAGMRREESALSCPREEFPDVVARLVGAGLRVIAEGKPLRPFTSGSGRVATGIDWFEVSGVVEFAGHRATLPELLRYKLTPDGFVELGDGSFGMLPAAWIQRLDKLRLLGGGSGDGGSGSHGGSGDSSDSSDSLRVPTSQALLLDAVLAAHAPLDFQVDRKFAALRRRLAEFDCVEPRAEPDGFCGELRPYQRQGLGWLAFLRDFGLGGCLADDMGLGKTVQLLAHLLARPRRRSKDHKPSLLVAPRSVLPNWLAEGKRFAPRLRILDFSQADRWAAHGEQLADCDLALSTYALIRTDAVAFAERAVRFDTVILDESQAIKNTSSQTAKAVRLLAADHRLALTGTPVENHFGELWSLFEFLNPGMLGKLPAFRALFAGDVGDESMRGNRELVQRALRPVMLRRTKAQVLADLPEKIDQVLWCELEPAQRRRYDQLRAYYQQKLLRGHGALDNTQRFVALEALLRLRQAACHEGLLDPARRKAKSGKLEVLLPRLEELADEGHKVLVFSQFTSMLDLLERPLGELGIAFERLDGRTVKREQRIRRFVEDAGCPVFLISLKAGGFGLNLAAADYVFLLDPWWNPAVEQQAIDRAHRIGQKRTVHAYRLACRDTVEERVLELQAQKRTLVEAVLGNERSLLQDLTREDLALLLG